MSTSLLARSLALLITGACALSAGCGVDDTGPGDAPDNFIAFNGSFADFRTWPMFHSELDDPNGTLPAGVAGARDQYINAIPPAGSTEFPVGTIIVESRLTDGKIFASVKRGANYNAAGCTNWEFFELQEAPVIYIWRGVGPPLGDTYGGDPNGCNNCHVQCAGNDFICSPQLQLPNF